MQQLKSEKAMIYLSNNFPEREKHLRLRLNTLVSEWSCLKFTWTRRYFKLFSMFGSDIFDSISNIKYIKECPSWLWKKRTIQKIYKMEKEYIQYQNYIHFALNNNYIVTTFKWL